MSEQPRGWRLPSGRVSVYVLVAVLAFTFSAGVGAMAALVLGGELRLSSSEKPQPSEEQGNAGQSEGQSEEQSNIQQDEEQSNAQPSEADYVSKVGKLQSESVKVFLDTHEKLLHYDAITADDIEELQADQAALQKITDQAGNLDAPHEYKEQKKVFLSAINELQEAATMAYALAADPTSATQHGFEEYDRHVDKAAAGLQRSNEALNRDYKTIEGVQSVSPA